MNEILKKRLKQLEKQRLEGMYVFLVTADDDEKKIVGWMPDCDKPLNPKRYNESTLRFLKSDIDLI